MLQHNNNNNYPCPDVAHRDLRHGYRRNGTTFSSALGFGAIPLIKGLRAWAVSGGYSRSKRKATGSSQPCGPAYQSRNGAGHMKAHPFHAPGVRQGGLGALVTVATLKDSDGGRQTQTQCLFLKAEGCNYLCALGSRVDRRKPGKGCQDAGGFCEGRPVRKWRKSSKRPKSMEDISVVDNKEAIASAKLDVLDKCSVTQCLKAFNNDEDHLNRSEFFTPREMCEPDMCSPTTKYDFGTNIKEDTTQVFVGDYIPADCPEISKQGSDLTADVHLSHVLKSKEISVPASRKHSPIMHENNGILSTINHSPCNTIDTFKYEMEVLAERNEFGVSEELELVPEELSEDANKANKSLLAVSYSHREEIVLSSASSNHSDDLVTITQEAQKIKTRIDDSPFNPDMKTGEPNKDMSSVSNQDSLTESTARYWTSPTCFSYHNQEIIVDAKLMSDDRKEVNTTNGLASSLSQCSGSLNVANAITSSPNPVPKSLIPLRSISRQQQEETEGMRLSQKTRESELLEKQVGGREEDKVVDKESEVVDEDDENEFGVFMKAGDEQALNETFNELQKVPCEKHAGIDGRNPVLNKPPSWMTDQAREPSNTQSDDTWTAFTHEEVVSRGTEKDCWFSSAVENLHLTHSVPNVFLEAFPCIKSSCGDSDCIPTLAEMLKGSAEHRPDENGRQNLLDRLQDLDRMIGVKYKVAESLSRKLLLQSLDLRTLNPDRAAGRKQNIARFSPNLPTSNQQLAANAKRRLSYDINRNIMS